MLDHGTGIVIGETVRHDSLSILPSFVMCGVPLCRTICEISKVPSFISIILIPENSHIICRFRQGLVITVAYCIM